MSSAKEKAARALLQAAARVDLDKIDPADARDLMAASDAMRNALDASAEKAGERVATVDSLRERLKSVRRVHAEQVGRYDQRIAEYERLQTAAKVVYDDYTHRGGRLMLAAWNELGDALKALPAYAGESAPLRTREGTLLIEAFMTVRAMVSSWPRRSIGEFDSYLRRERASADNDCDRLFIDAALGFVEAEVSQ